MSTDTAPMKLKDDEPLITPLDNPFASASESEGEPAPKTRKPRSDAGKPRGPRGARRKVTGLSKKIEAAIAMVAAGVATVDSFDSAIILHNAERLGNAWAPVVETNPKVAQFFASLEKGGVWGAAIMSTAAVLLPILLHHRPDVLPMPLKVVAVSQVPPEILAQMGAAQNGSPMNPSGN